jgi:hypothetical protein
MGEGSKRPAVRQDPVYSQRGRAAMENSRFKIRDLASRKFWQKSNKSRSCITELR